MLSGRPRASDTAWRASPTFVRSGKSFFAKIFVFFAFSVQGGLGSSDARATGGTITTFGDYVIHNFTSSGIFQVTDSSLTEVEVLVVGGGGSGGGPGNIPTCGGGGGGGVINASRSVGVQSYTVTVGAGAATYEDGGASAFDGMVAFGGKQTGGNDGGASGYCTLGPWFCNGVDYNVATDATEAQRAGGQGNIHYGAGGGGAGGIGNDGEPPTLTRGNAKGGDGYLSSISGTPTTMAAAAAAAVELTTSAGQEASVGVGAGVMALFCRNRANPTLGEAVVGTVVTRVFLLMGALASSSSATRRKPPSRRRARRVNT